MVTAVVARGLAPDHMGTYSLVQWIVSLAALAAVWGYTTTAMKFVAEHLGRGAEGSARGVLAESTRRVALGGLAAAALLAASGPPLATVLHQPQLTLDFAIAAAGVLPAGLLALWTAAHQGRQRYGVVAAVTAVCAPFTLAGTLGVLHAGWGVPGLLAVGAATATLGAVAYAVALSRTEPGWWKAVLAPDECRRMWVYTVPVFGLQLLDAVVWQRSEVFFLGITAAARQIAFYSLAFGLASMAMKLIPGTLIGLLIPNMARVHGAGDRQGVARIFRKSVHYMAVLALPVATGGTLLSGALVQALYGPAYLPVAPLLSAMLWASAVVMIYGFPASSALYATNGERVLVKIGTAVAVLNVVLDVALIPRWGAAGATAANSLAQLASVLPGLWAAHRIAGTGAPGGRLGRVALASAAMAVPVAAIARLLPPIPSLFVGVPAGAVVYGVALVALGGIEREDLARLEGLAHRMGLARFSPAR